MTKRFKVYLLLMLSAACIACTLVGCKIGRAGREEVLAGYKAHVTYYSNGGFFDDSTTITVRDLYFKNDPSSAGYHPDGVPFFDISSKSTGMNVKRSGYDLIGWYLPQRYPEGHERAGEIMYTYSYKENESDEEYKTVPVYPLLDERGENVTDIEADRPVFYMDGSEEQILEKQITVVASETKLDSSRRVGDDEELIVCAQWGPTLKIEYRLVCEDGKTYTDADGKAYKNGDLLREVDFGEGEQASVSSLQPVELGGTTFVRTYSDAELKTPAAIINRPEGTKPANPVVYSKYIEGEWNIVTNDPNQVENMFNRLGGSEKYYIIDDVDCSSVKGMRMKSASQTISNVTIEGNGHTISNLNFTATGAQQGVTYCIFGTFGAKFVLNDLKLSNISVDITAKTNITFFAISGNAVSGAKISGLEIENVTAKVKMPKGTFVTNAPDDVRGNWLFGGKGSDATFLAEYTGITVSGDNTLTVEN